MHNQPVRQDRESEKIKSFRGLITLFTHADQMATINHLYMQMAQYIAYIKNEREC